YQSPIHEKLKRGIRVLDMGCGPGWWTLEMARSYPRSKFVGIDMADVFVSKNQPSNVTFMIANAGTKLDFESSAFDFVFQRFLVMGFPTEQYLSSIKEIQRVLKPGGSIEILELINNYEGGGPALSQISEWSKVFRHQKPLFIQSKIIVVNQALEARGMDSFIAQKIPEYLKDTGYKQIESKDFTVPIGAWGGDLGRLHLKVQKLALPAVGAMITELAHIDSGVYRNTVEKALEEINRTQTSTRYKLIYASKQEN
ncbi:S-adenosyl-L-methionine-dependent methyltransferase, partial [Sporodiniella umbellata]